MTIRLPCPVCRRQRPARPVAPADLTHTTWACDICDATLDCPHCREPWSRHHQQAAHPTNTD